MPTPKDNRLLQRLIWLYLILLLTEGALRKWVLPSLATPLLIVRDPLVILIYGVAMSRGKFAVNGFVAACFLLAVGSFAASLMAPETNLVVTIIGLRCYFLHLPLIFVMERALTVEDITKMGKFLLWFAIPETLLCVTQFYTTQSHWSNLTVGGQITEGMSGANGHFRPSGTFSFTTGVAEFYPLALAMLLGFMLTRQKLPLYLSVAAGVSIAVAIPVSISRTNAVTCALVLLAGGASLFVLPSAPRAIMRTVLTLGLVTMIASWMPHFNEGVDAFNSRWSEATGADTTGFQTNIVNRFFADLLPPFGLFFDTPLLGQGVGSGTLMAQGYLTGQRLFTMGESEWPRLVVEMGPVLGLGFILLRVGLCVHLVRKSLAALRRANIWPILFSVEAFFLVLNAQWAQATIQGFATFCAGLALAACHINLTAKKSPSVKTDRRPPKGREWKERLYEPAPAPEGAAFNPRLPLS